MAFIRYSVPGTHTHTHTHLSVMAMCYLHFLAGENFGIEAVGLLFVLNLGQTLADSFVVVNFLKFLTEYLYGYHKFCMASCSPLAPGMCHCCSTPTPFPPFFIQVRFHHPLQRWCLLCLVHSPGVCSRWNLYPKW